MTAPLCELVPSHVWLKEYPVRIAGGRLLTRMTVLGSDDGGVFLHSPVVMDDPTRAAIEALGPVRAIIAPSNCHHLFVGQAQQAFPSAPTYGVAGVEAKRRKNRGQSRISCWSSVSVGRFLGRPTFFGPFVRPSCCSVSRRIRSDP